MLLGGRARFDLVQFRVEGRSGISTILTLIGGHFFPSTSESFADFLEHASHLVHVELVVSLVDLEGALAILVLDDLNDLLAGPFDVVHGDLGRTRKSPLLLLKEGLQRVDEASKALGNGVGDGVQSLVVEAVVDVHDTLADLIDLLHEALGGPVAALVRPHVAFILPDSSEDGHLTVLAAVLIVILFILPLVGLAGGRFAGRLLDGFLHSFLPLVSTLRFLLILVHPAQVVVIVTLLVILKGPLDSVLGARGCGGSGGLSLGLGDRSGIGRGDLLVLSLLFLLFFAPLLLLVFAAFTEPTLDLALDIVSSLLDLSGSTGSSLFYGFRGLLKATLGTAGEVFPPAELNERSVAIFELHEAVELAVLERWVALIKVLQSLRVHGLVFEHVRVHFLQLRTRAIDLLLAEEQLDDLHVSRNGGSGEGHSGELVESHILS